MTTDGAQAQAETHAATAAHAARGVGALLWPVAVGSPDQPLNTAPHPDAALLEARQITIPFYGRPTRRRVAFHHRVPDADGSRLVAAQTPARMPGLDRSGAMGAAAWLQMREGTAPAPRAGVHGQLERMRQ